MKTLIARSALSAAMLAGIVGIVAAQGNGHVRYRIEHLSTLGGTSSAGNSINDRGWAAGLSSLGDDQTVHAVVWRNKMLTDLGTLGGAGTNSAVLWPVKNVRGIITGIAQTDEPDPLGEIWSCGYFFPDATGTGKRCMGFRWQDGAMTRLAPFDGGTHSFATGSNNRGQSVGWAENAVRDPTCAPPQVLQFRAAVWGPGKHQLRELPPLPGDSVSSATAINDRGQVVGISGECSNAVGGLSAKHSVLWENGQPVDIGDFGGIAWNTPMAINQRGDIVGFANAAEADGTKFNPRAFLWTREHGLRNLGTLPGDVRSQALGINERRQVVGQSCDNARPRNCRAFLWQNGVMTDLKTLVTPGYTGQLKTANDIDDFGRITGQATDAGATVAFAATPFAAQSP